MSRVVLWVDRWSSRCGACGRSADPKQETHAVQLGYGPENGSPGCGARFEAIASEFVGAGVDEAVRAMRPDLPYLGVGFGFPQGAALREGEKA